MEENISSKESKEFIKELELRSRSIDTGNKMNFLKAIVSVANLASLIWIFNVCLTSCVKWWQLLIFIIITIITAAVICVENMIQLSKAAEQMINEQKSKTQHSEKTKSKKNNG